MTWVAVPPEVAEPLLRRLDEAVQECLNANVDPGWVIDAVRGQIYRSNIADEEGQRSTCAP